MRARALSLFLSGLLLTSLVSITARGWNLYHEVVRRIISDYGTALCVLLWTLVSLAPSNTPEGIPRHTNTHMPPTQTLCA